MIRYNFKNIFSELAKNYTNKTGIEQSEFRNKDYNILNNQLFNIIKKDYKKEIPYAHLIKSSEYNRDIIVYIPNKDLHERTFKKYGTYHKFTNDLINYVKIEDIPLDNFILEIDSGRLENFNNKKNKKTTEDKFEIIKGKINPQKYYNNENHDEALLRMIDIDGLTYFNEEKGGLYFICHNDEKIKGIIMLDNSNNIYHLNYVNVSNGSRGEGLALKMYKKMMDYIVENDGILIRSQPSEMGAAFIENKITIMLEKEFPFEPVLTERTKDIHTYLKLATSGLSKENTKKLKPILHEIINERKLIKKFNIMGEFTDYEISLQDTLKAEDMIKKELNQYSSLKNENKIKNRKIKP